MSIPTCPGQTLLHLNVIYLVPGHRDGYNGCCQLHFFETKRNEMKQNKTPHNFLPMPAHQAGWHSQISGGALLAYSVSRQRAHTPSQELTLGCNKPLNSLLGQCKGAADTHTFYFGGLLLHVLGMSLAQVVRCCHGRRGEGHVADGTTLVPVLPIAAFLLAVLCTENHRVAEAGRDLCRSSCPASWF